MRADFQTIVNAVAYAAELRPTQILSKRRFQETLDARWVVVRLMHEQGFYSSKIADHMNMTTRNVNYILFSFETRMAFGDRCLRNILERARKELGKSEETSS